MILVVDDQQDERQQIVRAARMMPTVLPVITAGDAQEALMQLRQHGSAIQLVVLDMRMITSKGILLIPHIHHLAPDARIIPYTIDASAAEQMELLGTLPRLQKILPAREIAAILADALQAPVPGIVDSPFYRYVADDAEAIIPSSASKQFRIAILGRSDLEAQGLRAIINRIGDYVRVSIEVTTHIAPTIPAVLQHPGNALIIGTLAVLDTLISFNTSGWMCAVHAAPNEDVSRVPAYIRVVFEASPARMADMIVTTEQDVLRDLSPRQRTVISYLQQGLHNDAVAQKLGVSTDRLYHILTEIYRTPGLPASLPELRRWAMQL